MTITEGKAGASGAWDGAGEGWKVREGEELEDEVGSSNGWGYQGSCKTPCIVYIRLKINYKPWRIVCL